MNIEILLLKFRSDCKLLGQLKIDPDVLFVLGNRAFSTDKGFPKTFPLNLRENNDLKSVIKNTLGVDEAGILDITKGILSGRGSELKTLLSCVGRKMVLKQLVKEGVELETEIVGNQTNITGFCSCGEISSFRHGMPCLLHSQPRPLQYFQKTRVCINC